MKSSAKCNDENARMLLDLLQARDMRIVNGKGKDYRKRATFVDAHSKQYKTIDVLSINNRWSSTVEGVRTRRDYKIGTSRDCGHRAVEMVIRTKLRVKKSVSEVKPGLKDRSLYRRKENMVKMSRIVEEEFRNVRTGTSADEDWQSFKNAIVRAD